MEIKYTLRDTWNVLRTSRMILEHITEKKYPWKKPVLYLVVQKISLFLQFIKENSCRVLLFWVLVFGPLNLVGLYLLGIFEFNTTSAMYFLTSCFIFILAVLVSMLGALFILLLFETFLMLLVVISFGITALSFIFKFNILKRIRPMKYELGNSKVVVERNGQKTTYNILSSFDMRKNKYVFIKIRENIRYIVIPERYLN